MRCSAHQFISRWTSSCYRPGISTKIDAIKTKGGRRIVGTSTPPPSSIVIVALVTCQCICATVSSAHQASRHPPVGIGSWESTKTTHRGDHRCAHLRVKTRHHRQSGTRYPVDAFQQPCVALHQFISRCNSQVGIAYGIHPNRRHQDTGTAESWAQSATTVIDCDSCAFPDPDAFEHQRRF